MYTRINDQVVENFKTQKKVRFRDADAPTPSSVPVTTQAIIPDNTTTYIPKCPAVDKSRSSCDKSITALWLGVFFILLSSPFILPQYLDILKKNGIENSVLFILHSIIFMIIAYFLL